MPLSDVRFVATGFLNQYILYRHDTTWNSLTGKLKGFFVDNPSTKVDECSGINKLFYNSTNTALSDTLNTLEDWIALIHTLSNSAREPSLLSSTLHAIRTYIITKILDSELKERFEAYRLNLFEKSEAAYKKIRPMMKNKQTRMEDVAALTERYYNGLLQLSDLSDEDSICDAMQLGLFRKLECPTHIEGFREELKDKLNQKYPYCYHLDYFFIHYEFYYKNQIDRMMPFEEFEHGLIRSGQTNLAIPDGLLISKPPVPQTTIMDGVRGLFWNAKKPVANEDEAGLAMPDSPRDDPKNKTTMM